MNRIVGVIGLSQKPKPPTMQPTTLFFTLFLSMLIGNSSLAQQDNIDVTEENSSNTEDITTKKHLNFFIITKRKKGKLDPATRFNVLRAKIKSFLCKRKFVAIVAQDSKQMSDKVQYRLKKYNAHIGTIWFDSHGKYVKGYSLFFIGHDEYNYKNVKEPNAIQTLQQLAALSDRQTKIVIGSCYGGATYYRSSIDYRDTTRMNGDSLMIGMGNIFNQATIYASESWVMTKPGLFWKRAAVAGYPKRKLFLDVCYRPAWETIGKWNEYNAITEQFNQINPVALDAHGNMIIRHTSYNENEKVNQEINKSLKKLEPGLYK